MRIYVGTRGGAFNPPSPTGLWRALRRAAVKAKVRLSRMANVGGNTHAARDARGIAAGLAGTVLRVCRGTARLGGMAVDRVHQHTLALREPMREDKEQPDMKGLARQVLRRAAEEYGTADDMTVLAVEVEARV